MRVPPDQCGTASDTATAARFDAAQAQLAGHASQAGGEEERFDAPLLLTDAVREVKQQARVALHRSADVAQQDQPSRPDLPAPGRGRLTTSPPRADASCKGPSQVHARAAAANPSARPSLAGQPLETLDCEARLRFLLRRELGEVLARPARSIRSTSARAPRPFPVGVASRVGVAGEHRRSRDCRGLRRVRVAQGLLFPARRTDCRDRARTRRRRCRMSEAVRGAAREARGRCDTRRRDCRRRRAAAPR